MHHFVHLVAAFYADKEERKKARFRTRQRRGDFTRILSGVEFIRHFRLDKRGFRLVCEDLRKHTTLKGTKLYPLELKVLLTLSFLATGSYQKIVGLSHHTPQKTVSRFVKEVVGALGCLKMLQKWITFPTTPHERNVIKNKFLMKFQLPGVIGCIDCTHINIVRPSEEEHLYYNRKGTHSINVQMISDSDMKIINVNPKFGGNTHDSMIWSQSNVLPFMRGLHQNGEHSHLLGDSGYPRRPWLMTPVLHAQPGSREYLYTAKHVQARNCIERCYGLLKSRWRCLLKDRTLHYTPAVASEIVLACAVLHNISQHLRLPPPPIDPNALSDTDDLNMPPVNVPAEIAIESVERAQGLAALQNILSRFNT